MGAAVRCAVEGVATWQHLDAVVRLQRLQADGAVVGAELDAGRRCSASRSARGRRRSRHRRSSRSAGDVVISHIGRYAPVDAREGQLQPLPPLIKCLWAIGFRLRQAEVQLSRQVKLIVSVGSCAAARAKQPHHATAPHRVRREKGRRGGERCHSVRSLPCRKQEPAAKQAQAGAACGTFDALQNRLANRKRRRCIARRSPRAATTAFAVGTRDGHGARDGHSPAAAERVHLPLVQFGQLLRFGCSHRPATFDDLAPLLLDDTQRDHRVCGSAHTRRNDSQQREGTPDDSVRPARWALRCAYRSAVWKP
jgi:hypothetical protein